MTTLTTTHRALGRRAVSLVTATALLGVGLLGGCGWNHLPGDGYYYAGELWSPADVIPSADGLYVPLTKTGGLMLVHTDGTWAPVDLGVGKARAPQPIPGRAAVAAFADTTTCAGDPSPALVADCAGSDLDVGTEVLVIENGAVTSRAPVSGHLNALTFAPNGEFAVAYLDGNLPINVQGVVNLTEVEVIDLTGGTRTPVRVGFAADRVLFTDDSAEAVVLSQSAVAVVDLAASPPVVTVNFPLTLTPSQVVSPVGVELTPDGSHALISVANSADLYVLDLVNPSVNLVSLVSTPTDMWVDAGTDKTALVYGDRAVLEVMDHNLFDTRQIALDQAMTNIVPGADFLLLYGKSGQKDVYRYLWDTGELIQYRLQNPATGLRLAPGGEFAVAMTRAEGTGATGVEGFYDGQPGMEILDLRGTSHAAVPYTLEGEGVGLAFTEAGGSLWSVVLQRGVEYLWRGELATGAADTIALAAPPLGIGTMPGGPFYVTHDDGLGLITFYDPATDTTEVAAGFALQGLLEDTPASETNQ